MIRKSLYIVGALAGALVCFAAAQAAPGEPVGNLPVVAVATRHYNEPLWLYDHIIDQDNPHFGVDRGGVGHGSSLSGGGNGVTGGGSGTHGGHGDGGEGHGGGHGGGGGRH
jgi:hypothetical protein